VSLREEQLRNQCSVPLKKKRSKEQRLPKRCIDTIPTLREFLTAATYNLHGFPSNPTFIYHPSQSCSHQSAINSIKTCRGSSIGRACGSYLLSEIFQTSRSWVRAPPSAIPNTFDFDRSLFVLCCYVEISDKELFF
jgi:hypothetical protein